MGEKIPEQETKGGQMSSKKLKAAEGGCVGGLPRAGLGSRCTAWPCVISPEGEEASLEEEACLLNTLPPSPVSRHLGELAHGSELHLPASHLESRKHDSKPWVTLSILGSNGR